MNTKGIWNSKIKYLDKYFYIYLTLIKVEPMMGDLIIQCQNILQSNILIE